MINQIEDVLHSTNLIPSASYPVNLYYEHVEMMNIKWRCNGLMRHATMKEIGWLYSREGEAPDER